MVLNLKGRIRDTDLQLQSRPDWPEYGLQQLRSNHDLQIGVGDGVRSEFSDILWADLNIGVGVVYGQKRPNLLKLLIDHRFEIEISCFVHLFY